jgi:hypothetical protein
VYILGVARVERLLQLGLEPGAALLDVRELLPGQRGQLLVAAGLDGLQTPDLLQRGLQRLDFLEHGLQPLELPRVLAVGGRRLSGVLGQAALEVMEALFDLEELGSHK